MKNAVKPVRGRGKAAVATWAPKSVRPICAMVLAGAGLFFFFFAGNIIGSSPGRPETGADATGARFVNA